MIINHNMLAQNSYRQLGINNANTAKSTEKLASGLRINRAGDDAAGLAISEKMRGQIRGLDQASRNAQDGISMAQTAEGALNETHSILQRMRELATQSANGTNTNDDRGAIQDEMNQLTSEVNRIGNTTEFNTQKLLNGGMASTDGAKITKATSATVTAAGTVTAATSNASIIVDGRTFDVSGIVVAGTTDADAKAAASALGDKTSGGVKLSEVVDIKTDGAGKLVFTAKSQGPSSSISFSADDAALGITAVSDKATGTPTTMERAGLQATNALGKAADTTINAGDTIKITVGNDSAVTVNLNTGTANKTYKTFSGVDQNEKNAAMADVIRDVNAALQDAGLGGKVTASLSKDNELQFISETGKDISVANGTGTPLTALGTGFGAVKNVEQVVGAGAQGPGFKTTFQIGANTGQSMALQLNDMRANALGITGNAGQKGFTSANGVTNGTTDVKGEAALNVMTKEDASNSITAVDNAIKKVSDERAKLGAVQNRLEHTINNLNTSSENLTSAESRIRDTDMAKTVMENTKNGILAQAAQAMLAQANQAPQQVLQLLR
ncbi:flagellin [Aneurinibacillus soli]|uniref:Flagellin n=1 Tax=Aneurinibacillus soli TaxID=1500254 RepID=A0A0U5ARX7_9BACL|nr:flagellin [Aneurinibacillus soli]PYE61484.1 flagellin [Aneurinibacillus soli]BAU26561.1 Flagellin [Aneurinibacillus soli]